MKIGNHNCTISLTYTILTGFSYIFFNIPFGLVILGIIADITENIIMFRRRRND